MTKYPWGLPTGGYDLCAPAAIAVTRSMKFVALECAFEIRPEHAGLIFSRSGLALRYCIVAMTDDWPHPSGPFRGDAARVGGSPHLQFC